MKILMVVKYPPIQGGVSASCYWLAQALAELGHRVTVLTNANEVEGDYRINLNEEDCSLLTGFRIKKSVRVVSTSKDVRHHFTPYANPYMSKIVSLGLDLIAQEKPDLIWAHYVEPYGIAALMLSKLTGIPYVIKHAGSDLGKLGRTPQMETLHQEVYRHALIVSTMPKHHPYFESIGVSPEKLMKCGFKHLPGDLFYPTPQNEPSEITKILIYGKTGPNKGTPQLIGALKLLKDEVCVTAYWGGKNLPQTLKQVSEAEIATELDVRGFIPHWRIPDCIREADAVLFLENNFPISFHGPGIPLEVLSCGRILITTEEIANKMPHLISEKNSIILEGVELTPEKIANGIRMVPKTLSREHAEDNLDASLVYAQGMQNLEEFIRVVRAQMA